MAGWTSLGPPDVAWQLAQAWPGAELTFIPGGHTGDEEMDRLVLEATARFAVGTQSPRNGPARIAAETVDNRLAREPRRSTVSAQHKEANRWATSWSWPRSSKKSSAAATSRG